MAAQQKFRFCGIRQNFFGFSDCVPAVYVPLRETRRLCCSDLSRARLPLLPLKAANFPPSRKLLKIVHKTGDLSYARRQAMLQRAGHGAVLQSCKDAERFSCGDSCAGAISEFTATLSRIRPERKGFPSSPLLLRHHDAKHNVRHTDLFSRFYSSSHGDEDDQRRKLRGAVIYVPNPVTWVLNRWNLAALRRKYDPGFYEDTFLEGARQAISYVLQLVSDGRCDQLNGLVTDEVMKWLQTFLSTLSEPERRALALEVSDMVLTKIHGISIDDKHGRAFVFVDTVCFALKVGDNRPFLVDMEIRFRRDYSSNPPSPWVVAAVTHLRLKNLARD